MGMHMYHLEPDGRLVFVGANPAADTILGVSHTQFIGKTIEEAFPPLKETEVPERYRLAAAKGELWQTEQIDYEDDQIKGAFEVQAFQAAPNKMIALFLDITRRKQAEHEIQRRNQELELLNAVIAASASGMELETILEAICRELAQVFDVPGVGVALLNEKKTAAEVVAEYRVKNWPSLLNQTILTEANPLQYLLTHKSPLVVDDVQSDPRLAPIHDILRQRGLASLLILPLMIEGEVAGLLGLETIERYHFSSEVVSLAWNVADQVAGAVARARLSQTRRLLGKTIDQAVEIIIITDPAGVILYVNPALEQVAGYSLTEIVGQNIQILESGHNPALFQEMWAAIKAGRVWRGRLVNRRKDGTTFTVETIISPVRDENGTIVNYVSTQRDVTRELQLEEQYNQAQKMEAIGQLTGGIAHDFNNLLTAINGFAELLYMRLPSDDPHQKLAANILHSGQQAAGLVRQLLAFSRKQLIEPKIVDLNGVVNNMGEMLKRIIGEDIDLKTNLSPSLWAVKVDPTQIEQVIANLVVNARDAMPAGGRLTIETTNMVLDKKYVAGHLGTQPGEHVLLAVSDTGVGMSKEVQTRIFEPFFTTKEKGKGTGLGLATVFGIVQQSGGNIWVYSEEGQGTTFKIYLPRAKEAIQALVPAEVVQKMPHGSETILLVEDDMAVRNLVRHILKEVGYTLLEAQDAQEAQHLAARYSGAIHLLLTDVVMPHMSGKALADQLVQIRPQLKILFMSGYTNNAIAHHGVLDPDVNFLQKPFTSTALAQKVRAVLDAS